MKNNCNSLIVRVVRMYSELVIDIYTPALQLTCWVTLGTSFFPFQGPNVSIFPMRLLNGTMTRMPLALALCDD